MSDAPGAPATAEALNAPAQRRPPVLAMVALILGGLLAAFAQRLLVKLPDWPSLPVWLADDLRPMWPHTGPAAGAVGLFFVAMICFACGVRRMRLESPEAAAAAQFPGLRRPAKLIVILGGLGLALQAYVLYLILTTEFRESHFWWFLVSLTLILAALAANESRGPAAPAGSRGIHLPHVLEALYVLAMAGLFFWLNTFDLGQWYYATIGDEHSFFYAAREVANRVREFNVFSQRGALDIIPVLSAYVEGVQMRLYGIDGFGWKTSIVVLIDLSLVASYLMARRLYGVRVAVVMLAMLATSHYLLAYTHTGYPNLEPLLPSAAALLFFVLGTRRSSQLLLVISGVWAAVGWYTYYTSRATIVILGAAVLVTVRARAWVRVGLTILAGFALPFVPLFLVNRDDIVQRMLEQAGGSATTEAAQNRALLPFWNTGRSLLAFNYNTHDGPYLYGSLAEPVTAALFVLGLGLVFWTWRDARSRLLMVWFIIGITLTGVLSKYDYVSVSRLNFMLPLVTLLAALAFDRFLEAVSRLLPRSSGPVVSGLSVLAIIAVVVWSNLYRWFVEMPAHVPSTPDTLVFRILEQPRCQTAAQAPLVVDVGIGGAIGPALDAYRPIVRPEFALYDDPPAWIETVPKRCVIFRDPNSPRAVQSMGAVEARWPEDKIVVERDRSGTRMILVYYPAAP